ncbi:MAG: nuclear transport factor 2 family protein [Myxococcaceae bacterium]
MRPFRLPALLLLVVVAAACKGPRWDTPEAAYATFAQAMMRGEAKLAYEALSASTHKAIEERSKELSAASGGAIRDDPVLLTFATGVKPRLVTEVKVVKVEGDTATVTVTAGGQTQEQRMVKEGGRWRVDLSETFKK